MLHVSITCIEREMHREVHLLSFVYLFITCKHTSHACNKIKYIYELLSKHKLNYSPSWSICLIMSVPCNIVWEAVWCKMLVAYNRSLLYPCLWNTLFNKNIPLVMNNVILWPRKQIFFTGTNYTLSAHVISLCNE